MKTCGRGGFEEILFPSEFTSKFLPGQSFVEQDKVAGTQTKLREHLHIARLAITPIFLILVRTLISLPSNL
jgi:hypothetical protein